MKFARPDSRPRSLAWAGAALCGALCGRFPAPSQLLANGIRDEARRLRDLRERGVRVPRVHLVADECLVLEDCGETVEGLLGALPPRERVLLLWSVADDLAGFHREGHWHGGAQLRNLTLKDGAIYRIDFEENIGAALPLELAQAYDVLLAFNSMIDHLDGDHALGERLLAHYLARVRSEPVVEALERVERWLAGLLRIDPYLPPRLRRKSDLRRTREFSRILAEAMATHRRRTGAGE